MDLKIAGVQKPTVRPARHGDKAVAGRFDKTLQRPQTQKAQRHCDRTAAKLGGTNISTAERLERMVHGARPIHAVGASGRMPTPNNRGGRGDGETSNAAAGGVRTSTPGVSSGVPLYGKTSTPYTPRAPRPTTRDHPRPQTSTPRPTMPGSAARPWKTTTAINEQGGVRTSKNNRTVAIVSFALDYKKYLEHRKKMIQLKVALAQNGRPNSSSSRLPFRQQLLNHQRMRPNSSGDGQGRRPGGVMNRPGWTTTAKANSFLDNDNFEDLHEFSTPDLDRDHATPVLPKDAFRGGKQPAPPLLSTNVPPMSLHKSAPNTPAHSHAVARRMESGGGGGNTQYHHLFRESKAHTGGNMTTTSSHDGTNNRGGINRLMSALDSSSPPHTTHQLNKNATKSEKENGKDEVLVYMNEGCMKDDDKSKQQYNEENGEKCGASKPEENEEKCGAARKACAAGGRTEHAQHASRDGCTAKQRGSCVSSQGEGGSNAQVINITRAGSAAGGHAQERRESCNASNTTSPPIATPREGEVHQGDMYVPPRPNTVSGVRTRPPTEGCLENYSFGKALGEGAYAQVYYARHLLTPARREVAIKVYDKYKLSENSRRRGVLREIKILARINHPNIVTFHEALDRTSKIFLVMEYCSGGSLFSLLKRIPGRCLEENHAKRLFYETSTGIKYLHDRYIVHRDIKLENILLDEFGTIKIIDFGFATVVPPSKQLKAFCGTPSYMAPEIVSRKEYIASAPDIWALGVLLFAILIGNFPFKGTNDRDLCRKIIKGVYIIPGKIGPGPRVLLSKILEVDMTRRMTIDDILHDKFLSSAEAEKKLSTSLHDTSTASTQIGTGQSSKETVNGQIPELGASGKVQEEAIAKLERLGYGRLEIVEQLSDETSHLSKLYCRFVKALNAWER